MILVQLICLCIIHFIVVVYKVAFNLYRIKVINVFAICGDSCFIVALILKMNDYQNHKSYMDTENVVDVGRLQKWYDDGQITLSLEAVFLCFYLLALTVKIGISIISLMTYLKSKC
jgi:hypothetical protein